VITANPGIQVGLDALHASGLFLLVVHERALRNPCGTCPCLPPDGQH